MRPARSTFALVAGVALAVLTGPDAAIGQGSGRIVVVPPPTTESVADWIAWKVFYDGLSVATGTSTVGADQILAKRFGLGNVGAAALRAVGQTYVQDIDRIDAAARAEIDRRWGMDLPRAANGTRRNPDGGPPRAVMIEPGKTLRQMARESGLYDEIEAQKATALAAHLSSLNQAVGNTTRASIAEWVQTVLAPRIRRADGGVQVGPLDHLRRTTPDAPSFRQ
jgi:hypothetical protein